MEIEDPPVHRSKLRKYILIGCCILMITFMNTIYYIYLPEKLVFVMIFSIILTSLWVYLVITNKPIGGIRCGNTWYDV
jgi:hypothetical protein